MIFNDIVMLEYDLYEIEKHTHIYGDNNVERKAKKIKIYFLECTARYKQM